MIGGKRLLFAPQVRPAPIFIILALALGLAVTLLPLDLAAFGLALAVLVLLAIIEPVNGIVILLLVAPLKALIETEATIDLPLDVGQIALLCALLAWAANRIILRRPIRLEGSAVQLPLLLIVGAALLSLPGALSASAVITETLKWTEMLVLVSLCLVLFRRATVEWLVFALVLAGALQASIGLYEFFGGSGAEHLRILDRFFRAFGTFGQPNPFGGFLGLILPFAALGSVGHIVTLWQRLRGQAWRPARLWQDETQRQHALWAGFYLAAFGLIAAGLVASWSRGAWMGFAGSAVVMLLFVPRSLLKGLAVAAVIVVLGLAAWAGDLLPDSLQTRMSGFVDELTTIEDVRGVDITDSNYAVTERIAHWQAAVGMATDHPWLGVGFGNYEVAYPAYALLNWPNALGHAHNYYLNLLAEVGIVGLAAYLIAWGTIFILTIQLWWRSEGLARAWCIALLGAWAYLTIHNAVDKLYVNNIFLHLGCMLGLLAILRSAAPDHTRQEERAAYASW
ncbi:MAG: O-antigen ligase family protein [Anaerolineae bacterium]|nr:O-antigen ligase family protein [Anaerolineae bacterium]